MNNRAIYAGHALDSKNVLLQTKTTNVAASFTLEFSPPAAEVAFTRPALYSDSGSGVTHPAWKAFALDKDGNELSSQFEGLTRTFGDIPLGTYTLRAPGFQGIAAVVFASDPRLNGVPFAGFSSLLIERIEITRR